jgi:hypothetical protein
MITSLYSIQYPTTTTFFGLPRIFYFSTRSMNYDLIKIIPSAKKDKKYDAVFEAENGRTKTTSFGAKGMDDYTITQDKEQRARYRERHKKDLQTGDPTKAGFLSYYLLWGNSTSIMQNLAAYRKKYNL